MSFENVIQETIYNALAGSTAITGQTEGIYDNRPQPGDAGDVANYPYITIGEDDLQEWDTATELGVDVIITLHTWSRHKGRKELKDIQGACYNLLHRANLAFTGYHLVGIDWQSSTSMLDSDGETRHGVQTFRITLDQL